LSSSLPSMVRVVISTNEPAGTKRSGLGIHGCRQLRAEVAIGCWGQAQRRRRALLSIPRSRLGAGATQALSPLSPSSSTLDQ
jgi:hypothetical protein